MTTTVPAELPISEARAILTDIATAAKEHHATTTLTKHGKPIAKVVHPDAGDGDLERIRRALADTYGEDYAGEDTASEIERLFRHLGEHDDNVQRILQAKNGAIERAQAERDALKATVKRVEALWDDWRRGRAPTAANELSAALDAPSTRTETP